MRQPDEPAARARCARTRELAIRDGDRRFAPPPDRAAGRRGSAARRHRRGARADRRAMERRRAAATGARDAAAPRWHRHRSGRRAFAVGTSLLCSLLFGLVPAWQATKIGVVDMIKQDPAQTRECAARRAVSSLSAQLALSLMLLVGAGLMARAFVSMRSLPLGFDPIAGGDHAGGAAGAALQRGNAGGIETEAARVLPCARELSAARSPESSRSASACSCR